MTATKEQFFKPGKRGLRNKNGVSEHKAMQMAAADAAERTRKTERLRQLREANAADEQTIALEAKHSKAK